MRLIDDTINCNDNNKRNAVLQEFNNCYISITLTVESETNLESHLLHVLSEQKCNGSVKLLIYRKARAN